MIGKLKLADLRDTIHLKIITIGLEVVKHRGNEQWNEIDVLNQIYTGNVLAFLGEAEDSITGYIKEEYGVKIFWIWTAFSVHGDAITYYWDDVKDLARQLGCSEIRFSSKRPGYHKILQKLGGEVHQTEYKVEIFDK